MSSEQTVNAESPYHRELIATWVRRHLIWLPSVVFAALLVAGLIALALVRLDEPPELVITHERSLVGYPSDPAASIRVDLNYATRAELEALPGIGRTTALGIIERRGQRPIRSLSELVALGILSDSQLSEVAPLVMLSIRETPP